MTTTTKSFPTFLLLLFVLLAQGLRGQAVFLSFTGGSVSSGGYTFTNNGSVSFPAGYSGVGATFSGNNSLSSTTNPVTGSFTIGFWMNTSTAGGVGSQWYQGAGLVDREQPGGANDWGVSLLGNKIALGIGNADTTITSTSSVVTGNWVYVTTVWNQSTRDMAIYINGSLEASGTSAGNANRNNTVDPLYIGQDRNGAAGSFYTGQLDEISIYTSAMDASAVQALYVSAVPEPACVAWVTGAAGLAVVGWRRRRQSLRA